MGAVENGNNPDRLFVTISRSHDRAERFTAREAAQKKVANMTAERSVLIANGDPGLRDILAEQLTVAGEFAVVQTDTVGGAERLLSGGEARFDAAILDSDLPDGDAWALCLRLRDAGRRLPILMLTGGGATQGVDGVDTIAKPFRLADLLGRLRERLRGFDGSAEAIFRIGPYECHPGAKCLIDPARDRRVRLTEKEVAILVHLRNAGTEAVTRQVLLNEVWGYNAGVTTHTLETHIYRLRRKIEPDPTRACLLLTEGGGYRLDPIGSLEALGPGADQTANSTQTGT